MKTRTKIWLGVGAFAFIQTAGMTSLVQPAEAGTCGWVRNDRGQLLYDDNCEKGERYISRPGAYNNERGERWEKGERWNERGERWNSQYNRWEHGNQWRHGERGERWGERG